jgi:hypothetical protein
MDIGMSGTHSAWFGMMTLLGREWRRKGENERELRLLEGGRESCELKDGELGVWGRELEPSSSYNTQTHKQIFLQGHYEKGDDRIRKIEYRLDERHSMFLIDIVPK